MTGKIPITKRGAENLRAELKELKSVARPRVIEAIAEARAHGDLKENAEYHAARDQQSFIEGRIGSINGILGNAQIIDVTTLTNTGKIVFGATVVLSDEETGNEITYQIVGEDEADIKKRLISVTSPIARALIGQQEGDIAEVKAPDGIKTYEILEIKYE